VATSGGKQGTGSEGVAPDPAVHRCLSPTPRGGARKRLKSNISPRHEFPRIRAGSGRDSATRSDPSRRADRRHRRQRQHSQRDPRHRQRVFRAGAVRDRRLGRECGVQAGPTHVHPILLGLGSKASRRAVVAWYGPQIVMNTQTQLRGRNQRPCAPAQFIK